MSSDIHLHVRAHIFLIPSSSLATSCPGSRPGEPCPSSAAGGNEETVPATEAAKGRSLVLGLAITNLAQLAESLAGCPTRDGCGLASARFPPLLDLDFQAKAIRASRFESRSQGSDPKDGGS